MSSILPNINSIGCSLGSDTCTTQVQVYFGIKFNMHNRQYTWGLFIIKDSAYVTFYWWTHIHWVHLLHNTPKRPNVSSFCCVPELNFLTLAQVQVQIVNNIFIVRKGDLYLMENISKLFCSFCHFDLFSLVHIVHFLHLTRFLREITRTKYTSFYV